MYLARREQPLYWMGYFIIMAENKKSFLLYCDLIHTVEKMPDDKAGQLLKHILGYVNDLNPKTEDLIIQLTFEPIKQQLKRDLVKYEEIKIKRSKAGLASVESKQQKQQVLTSVESVEQMPTKSTVTDKVNVTDNVKVNVIDTVSDKETVKEKKINKKEFVPNGTFQTFIEDYSLFFEKKTGIRPKIGSSDGKAANELIEYLTSVSTEKNETGAIESFRFILKEWGKLDNFYGSQIKLIQISSNINNIINQIKNGKSKSTVSPNQQLRDKIRDELADKIRNGSGETTNT